jgi:hypothetical protein
VSLPEQSRAYQTCARSSLSVEPPGHQFAAADTRVLGLRFLNATVPSPSPAARSASEMGEKDLTLALEAEHVLVELGLLRSLCRLGELLDRAAGGWAFQGLVLFES